MKSIKTITLGAILLGLTISLPAAGQQDTLSFFHITDTHFLFDLKHNDPDVIDFSREGKRDSLSFAHFETFVDEVARPLGISHILHTGDIVEYYQSISKEGHLNDTPILNYKKYISDFPLDIYYVLGNHDAFSLGWTGEKWWMDQNSEEKARSLWIRNFDAFSFGTCYAHTISVGETSYKLIFIDDNFYRPAEGISLELPYLDPARLSWLQTELEESKNMPVVLMMHIPFGMDALEGDSENKLLRLVQSYPSIRLILAGHTHHDNVTEIVTTAGSSIYQVETDAMIETADHWRTIRFTEEAILVSHQGSTETQITIPIQ